LGLDPNNKDN
jgi:serine/threonine-protein kinase ULK4